MTPYNEHVRLAQAMLGGHLYIDPAPSWMEHIHVNGHDYILHPPLSGFICLPFVATGIADQGLISTLIGIVSAMLVYHLTRSGWLTTFFIFGTTFFYESTLGASWNFALVASTPFTTLSILGCELGWPATWVGLTSGLAFLARYDLILATPIYFCYLHSASRPKLKFVLGLLPAILVYIWFNEARFGTLTDISVTEWYWHYDTFRAQRPYGPFSVHYIPFAIYTLVFMAPNFVWSFPWIRPQFMGQSILSVSPGFLLTRFSWSLVAAIMCSLPALTVYASGFSQLGCRYYVQVFPFLVASMDREVSGRAKALIILSILSSQYFTTIAWVYGLTM